MSDKERLEEIKNSYLEGLHRFFGTPWVSMPKENLDWLINRVEELAKERAEWEIEARTQYAINKRLEKRVEELETKLSINTNNMKHLQNKIERYKQALENITISPIQLEIDDAVNIARQALEGEE